MESFFDRSELDAFAFWARFNGHMNRVRRGADSIFRNMGNMAIVRVKLHLIDVELNSIKDLLIEKYHLVLDTNPSHKGCVEAADDNNENLAALYFWSMDHQPEVENVVNILSEYPLRLQSLKNVNSLQSRIGNIFNTMHALFSLVVNAMSMPVTLLKDFHSFLSTFRSSQIGLSVVSAWRKDYVLPQQQLLLRLKEVESYRPWVDKCRLLHEGKIEKRELFVDKTVPGVQHNKEMYMTNSWLSIFTIMSVLEEYNESRIHNSPQSTSISAELTESVHWKKLKGAGLIGDDEQPRCSRTEAAIMAEVLLEKMDKGHEWKLFERLWNRKHMSADFQYAVTLKKYPDVRKKVQRILS